MEEKQRVFLRGFGGILNIMPARRHSVLDDFQFERDTARRLANAWQRTGDALRKAMTDYEYQGPAKKA